MAPRTPGMTSPLSRSASSSSCCCQLDLNESTRACVGYGAQRRHSAIHACVKMMIAKCSLQMLHMCRQSFLTEEGAPLLLQLLDPRKVVADLLGVCLPRRRIILQVQVLSMGKPNSLESHLEYSQLQ
jgi:hypothetical protein